MSTGGLSPREFAEAAGIPASRVRRMVAAGTLEADRSSRAILIPPRELRRWRGEQPGMSREEMREEIRAMFHEVVLPELPRLLARALIEMGKA